MEIAISGNKAVIRGNIKSIGDYQQIRETLDRLVATQKSIVIRLEDSISIISSVIGYLTKLVQKDGIDIRIEVGNDNLYDLFEEINLLELFKVSKIR